MNRTYLTIGGGLALTGLLSAGLIGGGSSLLVMAAAELVLACAVAVLILWRQPRPSPPSVYGERIIENRPIPSTDPDFGFVFSARVRWRFVDGREDMASELAIEQSVIARASAVSAEHDLENQETALGELRSELAIPEMESTGAGRAWAKDVVLVVSDEGAKLLAARVELRRERRLRHEKRVLEKDLRSYLQTDAMATPGNAVAWWLAQHDEQTLKERVKEAAELKPILDGLSGIIGTPPATEHPLDAAEHLARGVWLTWPGEDGETQRVLAMDRIKEFMEAGQTSENQNGSESTT